MMMIRLMMVIMIKMMLAMPIVISTAGLYIIEFLPRKGGAESKGLEMGKEIRGKKEK